MAILYSIREIKSSLQGTIKKKFYPVANRWEHVGFDEVLQEMVRNTTLHPSEARAAMDFLAEAIPHFLEMGNTVSLGSLGYMKIKLISEGSDTKEEATHHKIKDVRVSFIASREFRDRIRSMPIQKFPERGDSPRTTQYSNAMLMAKQKEAEDSALRCLAEGLSLEQTARITGLSPEEIAALAVFPNAR
ncbi:hypothetical protein LJB91_04020 [Bacteroidales bacterium OttesenSCG-928-L03]|nr:hypothetical protein [Bacteroidales bacterium OttesenSCG-928-L03]